MSILRFLWYLYLYRGVYVYSTFSMVPLSLSGCLCLFYVFYGTSISIGVSMSILRFLWYLYVGVDVYVVVQIHFHSSSYKRYDDPPG